MGRVEVLVVGHYDGHGVATAAARARVLRRGGAEVAATSSYPEAGPEGLGDGSLLRLVEPFGARLVELVDIPVDARRPEASISTLARLRAAARVRVFDHHDTTRLFAQRLAEAGVELALARDGLAMAWDLGLLGGDDLEALELAIVGLVSDRDASVLRVVGREEVESRYLPLANRLDVAVRSPRALGLGGLGELVELLAERGPAAIPRGLEYPPERLARELLSAVVEEGPAALLVDWRSASPEDTRWAAKTLEQLALMRRRAVVVAVVPGYNPRTGAVEGWDVRAARYWLAADAPQPRAALAAAARRLSLSRPIVGHPGYAIIRLDTPEQAMELAREVVREVEREAAARAEEGRRVRVPL